MKTYWIHVLRMGPTSQSLTIALSDTPTQINYGAPLPTAIYPSWEKLSAAFIGVGVSFDTLTDTKARIWSQGFATVRDISLSEEQLEMLGFNRRAVPRSAAA
jgi:hypothetical protein